MAMTQFDEIMNELSMDISDVHSLAQMALNSASRTSATLQKVIELHEIDEENFCSICPEEPYPCETVEVILNGFGYSIK